MRAAMASSRSSRGGRRSGASFGSISETRIDVAVDFAREVQAKAELASVNETEGGVLPEFDARAELRIADRGEIRIDGDDGEVAIPAMVGTKGDMDIGCARDEGYQLINSRMLLLDRGGQRLLPNSSMI